jgi:diguanylate cyclase
MIADPPPYGRKGTFGPADRSGECADITGMSYSAWVGRRFVIGVALAGVLTAAFSLVVVTGCIGTRATLAVDVVGEWGAAWAATVLCLAAATRATRAWTSWMLLAVSSFLWGLGEAVWSYYALVRDVTVPFPSLADVGFLLAVPFAVAALLLYPEGGRRTVTRVRALLDGSIVALSVLFASWATVLGPLFRAHHAGRWTAVVSLAYPVGDIVMLSLVVILLSRAGRRFDASLGLILGGVALFAVADSTFVYLAGIGTYSAANPTDTGWFAGYLLVALAAWFAYLSPAHPVERAQESTVTLVAPYVPVLVVLGVTSVQLLRGRHVGTVSWSLAFVLAVLVVARELTGWQRRPVPDRGSDGYPDDAPGDGAATGGAGLVSGRA